jgi:hypothetical protein
MHTRSSLLAELAVVFVVSLIVVDRTEQVHLIAPPVDVLPRLNSFGLQFGRLLCLTP